LKISAKFTSLIFLRPKPFKDFGRQKESQALRERFLDFFGWKPHQKFLKILSRAVQKLFGSIKELMA
jgi:hypothetical protein